MKKKIVYFDMDNVLVNFQSGIDRLPTELQSEEHLDEVEGIFSLMDPIEGAIEAFHRIAEVADAYILSTAPWNNPSAWSDKLLWVKKHLGEAAKKRLILSHNKHLNKGAILIDDRDKNGADRFEGVHIKFGSEPFTNWELTTIHVLHLLGEV